jgi:GT2 family glycosyltransferase
MSKVVALILLNWNTPVYTANCIASLKKYCNEDLFDIIIADNGSTDNSLALLADQFPGLTFIENKENLGFAEGNNRALMYSLANGYTYSLLINTDTLVDEDIVSGLVNHLNNHLGAAAVQPAIYWMHDKTKIWNGEGKFNSLSGNTVSDRTIPNKETLEGYKEAEWVTGCCVLLRNSALSKCGLFNKRFFLYYEDVELSFNLREAGFTVHYLPSLKIYHEAGVSAKLSTPKKEGTLSPIIHYYISRNHIWLLRRYGVPLFYPVNFIYNGFYYLTLLAYFKVRGRNEKAKLLIKGIKEGFLTPKKLIWPQTGNTSTL